MAELGTFKSGSWNRKKYFVVMVKNHEMSTTAQLILGSHESESPNDV
jgi:hypothetical protein